jgi:3-hydroxyisobutyrate dehydrogenase-like beta-hydroxyacid dehydrogenase
MRVAVVGLGKMGAALSRRLLSQGVDVSVWNRTPTAADDLVAAGASRVTGLGSVWDAADTVFTFLADDRAVEAVCLGDNGLVEAAHAGALLVEMSTISPAASMSLATGAAARGLHYLRCPVSGNPGVLAAGNLTLIVSGERSAFEDANELLSLLGSTVIYVGGSDEARVIKLAVNAMLAATAEMLAESITLCEAAGVDRSVLLDVLTHSAVGSPIIAYKRDPLNRRDYSATFTTAMLAKDLQLVASVGETVDVPLPVTSLVAKLVKDSCDEQLGDLDFLALLPHLQALAGRPTDVPVVRAGTPPGD